MVSRKAGIRVSLVENLQGDRVIVATWAETRCRAVDLREQPINTGGSR
jgi:hypothetical protein